MSVRVRPTSGRKPTPARRTASRPSARRPRLRPALVDAHAEGIGPSKHAIAALQPGDQVQLISFHGEGRIPFWVRLTRVPPQPNPIHPPTPTPPESVFDYVGIGEPDTFWADFRGKAIEFSRVNIALIG